MSWIISNTGGSTASAQSAWDDANKGRIGVITGGVTGTYVRIGADLSAVLDGYGGLRVVPMLGKGSVQNIADLLYLSGVDVGIVQSDVLTWMKTRSPDSPALAKLAYLTKLYDEEIHILAAGDLRTIADLAGKRVNVGPEGSGTSLTASLLFPFLGIAVDRQNMTDQDALERLKEGAIDALMFVAGKPTPMVEALAGSEGLHLVEIPFAAEMNEVYSPAYFWPDDYPELVKDEPIATVAVSAVMAVYDNFPEDHPRRRSLVKFTEGLAGQLDQFRRAPRHAKWLEVELDKDVPGWKRFEPMEVILAGGRPSETRPRADQKLLDGLRQN